MADQEAIARLSAALISDAPHYLQWIGAQGFLGTISPWWAIVAADMARRIRWRRCAPRCGAGRLLWMFEQVPPQSMPTPPYPACGRPRAHVT